MRKPARSIEIRHQNRSRKSQTINNQSSNEALQIFFLLQPVSNSVLSYGLDCEASRFLISRFQFYVYYYY